MSRILCCGIDKIDKDIFSSPSEPWKIDRQCLDISYLNKPNGCLWGSTYTPNSTYMSDWLRWVTEENFHTNKYSHGISFTLKKKSKICTIDTVDDYIKVLKKYSRFKYGKEELREIDEKVIDFAKLSKDYDAFHLTENAFWTMRLPWFPLQDSDGYRLSDFYSYDCETWIIFNLDCINEGSILNHSTKYIPQERYDKDGDF